MVRNGINTDAECSVEIDVTTCNYKELNGQDPAVPALPVTINLYKVADIDAEGNYYGDELLGALDFSELSYENATAAVWENLAEAAKTAVDVAMDAEQITISATETTVNGVAVFTSLKTGLYLVDAQQVLSDDYQYDFKPYLISLPNNYYYDNNDDTWVYDLTGEYAIGVKPVRSDRYENPEISQPNEVIEETEVIITDAVKTGDESSILLFGLLALGCGIALMVSVMMSVRSVRSERVSGRSKQ